jgi:lipopolysaccharide export system permease protein
VLIEDQSNLGQVKFNQILADSGQMYTTEDRRFFVMNLFEGVQYQEPGNQGYNSNSRKFPFIRTSFKSWTKVWDMREFEMVRTEEGRFSQQRATLSMKQLRDNVDSLSVRIRESGQNAVSDMLINLKRPLILPANPSTEAFSEENAVKLAKKSLSKELPLNQRTPPLQAFPPGVYLPVQEMNKPLESYASFAETFRDRDRSSLLREARTRLGLNKSIVETRKSQAESRRLDWVKTGYELYNKYSFALVCFIFLFVGAPMGAIIRKGGFGYPILVSIVFFVMFVFLAILCRKLAESYLMSPFWAAMTPCAILAVIGMYITRKAMNDSQLFSTERMDRFFFRLRNLGKDKKNTLGAA